MTATAMATMSNNFELDKASVLIELAYVINVSLC
jgi:hypothetical protein